MTKNSIPNYELYGELLSGSYTDPVHHETIQERSSKHHWTIRLHRHKRLAQVFLFQTPGVSFRVADITHTSSEPIALFIPPGIAHGFRFAEEVVGDVLSLRTNELGSDLADLLDRPEMRAGAILPCGRCANFDLIQTSIAQLGQTYHGMKVERAELLLSLTQLIIICISGDLRRETSIGNVLQSLPLTRHEAQAESFCGLVEQFFSEDLMVRDYADKVGISAPHLTRLCRNILGAPPHDLVRQRRLLEAKRLLEYTRLSVSEIAHKSGFRESSFFSRTFSRTFGVSPKSYREDRDR
ncbi:hypothetical protein P775_24615 [Puniceibacterium antarcticum]|uniref:HTH araC/xylS-type domain-containing protein n=1 Tax=Puniceibacterium antarcticum TaxID=1206336 RepID=A0A2G8R6Q9_9RHOB|nr:helix-turn-helix domain-containing protein [Puniceibacterium antarcticum]PIL17229.1 hypothetical protein P775_24615 [Puniceibacterium antarcticum]